MFKLTKDELDEVIDFVVSYYSYNVTDKQYIAWTLQEHAAYNTLMVIREEFDAQDIIAVCRWNILPTGQDAVILDIIIHPRWRNKNLMHRMLLKGLTMYPDVNYLIFERRTEGKPFKKMPVRWLLKRRF